MDRRPLEILTDGAGPLVGSSAEEELARERAILQYVVDHVPAWIFWKDRDSVYLGCNTRFAALDGRTDPRELVGRSDSDMAWAAIADQYRAGDREVMERGESVLNREELSPDGKGGEMVILTSKVPMRNPDGEIIGLLGILFDITDRKRAELELQKAKEAAEQATRVKGEFIANMSHELRTPLTLILGPVIEALKDPSLEPRMRPLLERIERNGFRLYDLVNDVLDLSKAEAGSVTPRREILDVVSLVRTLVDDMQPLAGTRGLSLSFSTSAPSLSCALDPKMVERIVLNLVSNALKFTPAGGSVRVSLSQLGDDRLRIAVADTGVGISRESQARLFQPFVQLDSSMVRAHEGTGLGLALVKHFAEALDGSVSLESEEGRGSTFSVELRLPSGGEALSQPHLPGDGFGRRSQRAAVAARIGPVASEAVGPLDRPRVLVADDNPDMRAFVVEALCSEFAVCAVEDGEQAWERLQSQPFDVVVSDVMMPRLDGLALTGRLKADPSLGSLPVILVTARGGTEAVSSGLDAGADDYLPKPFAPEELRARVRAAIRMRQLQNELRAQSRLAGMADVATSVLHNVGNVLNSVNVSSDLLARTVRSSKLSGLERAVELLQSQPDPGRFLSSDPRGQKLVPYLAALASSLGAERTRMLETLEALDKNIGHIRAIVRSQQSLAGQAAPSIERFTLTELVDDALRLEGSVDEWHAIQLVRSHAPSDLVETDRHKLLQILVNLLSNARHAVRDRELPRVVSIRSHPDGSSWALEIEDNGVGIAPENLPRIFELGFTTRASGHGYGLHSSACAAAELGATLGVQSPGLGRGARFTLVIPRSLRGETPR